MIRSKQQLRGANSFQYHLEQNLQAKFDREQRELARQRKAVMERRERILEAAEDLEFDRVHHVKQRRSEKQDPLYRLNQVATQLQREIERDPELAAQLNAQEAVASHEQARREYQESVAAFQSKQAASVADARNELAAWRNRAFRW